MNLNCSCVLMALTVSSPQCCFQRRISFDAQSGVTSFLALKPPHFQINVTTIDSFRNITKPTTHESDQFKTGEVRYPLRCLVTEHTCN